MKAPDEANYNPLAVLKGDTGRNVLPLKATPGQTIDLNAEESLDPDNNALTYRWWQYKEAGTYAGEINIADSESPHARVPVLEGTDTGTIHVILEVTDNGAPPLTSYRRAVVKVDEGKK